MKKVWVSGAFPHYFWSSEFGFDFLLRQRSTLEGSFTGVGFLGRSPSLSTFSWCSRSFFICAIQAPFSAHFSGWAEFQQNSVHSHFLKNFFSRLQRIFGFDALLLLYGAQLQLRGLSTSLLPRRKSSTTFISSHMDKNIWGILFTKKD